MRENFKVIVVGKHVPNDFILLEVTKENPPLFTSKYEVSANRFSEYTSEGMFVVKFLIENNHVGKMIALPMTSIDSVTVDLVESEKQ